MFTKEEIVDFIINASPEICASGSQATFVPIAEGWGFKFYDNYHTALYTYDRQKEAANWGIAPAVGEWFEFEINGNTYCGYLTEIAGVCFNDFAKSEGLSPRECTRRMWDDEDIMSRYDFFKDNLYESEEYANLMERLADLGFRTSDMHPANIGYLGGQMVAIDFDLS